MDNNVKRRGRRERERVRKNDISYNKILRLKVQYHPPDLNQVARKHSTLYINGLRNWKIVKK